MGKKIYVGNLSYNMDDQTLGQVFSAFGTVESARIVTDRESGRSKGFGFVEMGDEEGAQAIEALNQKELNGKILNVSEAKPREEKPRRSFDNNRSGGGSYGNNRGGGNSGGGYGSNNNRGGNGGGGSRW